MRSWIISWGQKIGELRKSGAGKGRFSRSQMRRNLRLEPLEKRELLSAGPPEIGYFHASGGASQFILDSNGNRSWDAQDQTSVYGDATDTPVVGDWNGDGLDEIGIFRVSNGFGEFILDSNASGSWDPSDTVYDFGNTSDMPISGDWNNDGVDEIGVFRAAAGYGQFILDSNADGVLNDTIHD